MIALRPEDTALRLQVVQQLVQENQAAAAVEHYKVLLQKEPAILRRYFYQVQNAFQQVGKAEELMNLLEQMDFRQFGQSAYLFNMIANMSNDKAFKGRAASFMKKAWEAFRMNGSSFCRCCHDSICGNCPRWRPISTRQPFRSRDLSAAQSVEHDVSDPLIQRQRPDDLGRRRWSSTRRPATASSSSSGPRSRPRKTIPAWTAGEILVPFWTAGWVGWTRPVRPSAASRKKVDLAIQSNVYWIVGEELENHSATRDLAYSLYEAALNRTDDDPYSRLQFNYAAARSSRTSTSATTASKTCRRLLLNFAKTEESAGSTSVTPSTTFASSRFRGWEWPPTSCSSWVSPPTRSFCTTRRSASRPRSRPMHRVLRERQRLGGLFQRGAHQCASRRSLRASWPRD